GQALALFVIGWKVESEAELHAVRALVRDKLLGDAAQLRLWIRKMRELLRSLSCVCGADKIVGWIRWTFMPGNEFGSVRRDQIEHGFILLVRALEQAVRFARGQIIAVKERKLAFGRSARPGKKDGIALLPHDVAAVGQGALQRYAGIFIAVANGALPDQPRLRSRLVEIDEKSACPAAIAIVVPRQSNAILAPLESAPAAKSKEASAQAGNIALLQLDQLHGLFVERRA